MAAQEKSPPKVNLDKILIEEIGPFGRFQIMILLFVAIAIIFAAISGAEWVFTTGRLPIRCLIPECDGTSPEFEPAWLSNAVPGSPGNYDECNRFNISADTVQHFPPNTCPSDLFNQDETIPCDQYVHELTNTVVYDFGLECDEWRRSLIGTIRTVGQLLAMPIVGFISDRWGRRIALCIIIFNGAWIGLLRAFVNNYEWFIALHVFEAMFSATFPTGYIIVSEFVGPKYRVIAGPLLSSCAAVGFALNGLLAWAIQDWRHRTMIIFIPQLLTIGYYWIIPESARWLISKGRYTEAEITLQRAAKVNRKELSENTSQALRYASLKESDINNQINNEPSLIAQVLKSRVILVRCCVTSIWWFTTLLVYYGISINAVSLAGNQYLNYIYVSLIEIPGFFTAMIVLDRIGRKLTLIAGFLVCTACQFGFAFIPDDNEILLLVLYLLGKYSISLVVTSIYMYTAELYPTKCRQSLLSFSSMMGRVGQIIAPLTPALMMYWPGIPSVMFGSMTLLCAVLMLTTPETLGIKLPDTIEEAEDLGRKLNSKENNDHYEITKI